MWEVEMATVAFLVCTECKSRNYVITKSKGKKTARLELRKYCKKCRRHTLHRESK